MGDREPFTYSNLARTSVPARTVPKSKVVGVNTSSVSPPAGTARNGAPNPIPPYRKYGPTTPGNPATAQWYDFPGATFGSRFVGGVQVATVTLSLVDGALGDATGVDGAIVDPGGPAVQEVPALSLGGVAALALLLGALAAGTLRVHRGTASRDA